MKRDWTDLYTPNGNKARFWTPARYWQLLSCLERGLPNEQIADEMGTTVAAIKSARQRAGIPGTTRQTHNATSVARMFGFVSNTSVRGWINSGALRARRGPQRGRHVQWVISDQALRDFVSDTENHRLFTVEKINDPTIRAIAASVRDRVATQARDYLTTHEVADQFLVSVSAVQKWIREGMLPAWQEKPNTPWWINRADLEGFEQPVYQDWSGYTVRRYTEFENRTIVNLKAQGVSWAEIGQRLGRKPGTLAAHYHRYLRDQEAA